MHLSHLSLANVRTFRRLELPLQPGVHVVTGENGSGKSNLLEAIALLATTRSARASSDADLVSWGAAEDEGLPVARLSARVESAAGPASIEVVLTARVAGAPDAASAGRRFRVNGVARRASDLIGRLRVVLFAADDLGIIDGPPAVRRRYLDITISQLDAAYVRALQRYQRVLQQRNSLLRRLQERRAAMHELDFWDGELAEAGAYLAITRAEVTAQLAEGAAARYAELSAGSEPLAICYRPGLPSSLAETLVSAPPRDTVIEQLRATLEQGRMRDVQAGVTRAGPHRDDVSFLLAGHEAGANASRGQQRTAALALRLAEVSLSTERTGEPPVLLLDDVLSELDAARRARVLQVAYAVDQAVLTTPDSDRPSREELPEARRYRITPGTLDPCE